MHVCVYLSACVCMSDDADYFAHHRLLRLRALRHTNKHARAPNDVTQTSHMLLTTLPLLVVTSATFEAERSESRARAHTRTAHVLNRAVCENAILVAAHEVSGGK